MEDNEHKHLVGTKRVLISVSLMIPLLFMAGMSTFVLSLHRFDDGFNFAAVFYVVLAVVSVLVATYQFIVLIFLAEVVVVIKDKEGKDVVYLQIRSKDVRNV